MENVLDYLYSREYGEEQEIRKDRQGGGYQRLYSTAKGIIESGAKLVVLTALDMDANPNYDRNAAAVLADMGAFVGAMTPEELAGWIGKMIA